MTAGIEGVGRAAVALTLAAGVLGAAASAARQQAAAAVVPVDREGVAIRGARYVAIVPEDRPWREPVKEAMVAGDKPVPEWYLEPGRYGVICAAEGYGFRLQAGIRLTGDGTRELDCRLRPTAAVGGTVIDRATGLPVAGAVVSLAGRFRLEAEQTLVSPLGAELIRDLMSSRTGAGGEFQLAGPPGGRGLVWVEAKGYAPLYLPLLTFSERGEPFAPMPLDPGGALSVALDLPAGFPAGRYHLALRAADLVWPLHDPGRFTREQALAQRRHLASHLWKRPVPEGAAGAVHWPALPPGSYEVWLKGADLGGHDDLPFALGTVSVAAGEVAELSAKVPWQPPLSAGDEAPALRLLVRASADQLEGLAAVRWHDGGARDAAARSQAVSGGTLLTLAGGCRRGTWYTLSTPAAVSAAIAADPAICRDGGAMEARLRPAVGVAGQLDIPQGFARPKRGRLWADACGASDGKAGPFLFEVDENGAYRARVAAGCGALSLQSAGFAPLHWSGLSLRPNAEVDLGRRKLEPGSSLLMRVRSGTGGQPLGGALVELIAAEDARPTLAPGPAGRPAATIHRQRTGDRGWARFAGLEAGPYVARLTGPETPVPTFTKPFTIVAGQEMILEDVEVLPPATVELEIEDLRGLLEPGQQLQVDAYSDVASCGYRHSFELPVKVPASGSEAGIPVDLPPMFAGLWKVTVALADGAGNPQVVGDTEFTLAGGAWTREVLRLDGSYFHGIVRLRDEPVHADLELTPQTYQDGALGARSRSDEEGRFDVPLAKAGIYEVRILSEDLGLALTVTDVHFEEPEIEVEIDLPEGGIEGRVVDSEGRPLPGGVVTARAAASGERHDRGTARPEAGAFVGDDGSFALDALVPGRWTLEAVHDRERSRPLLLDLGEDERLADLELVIEEGVALNGRVLVAGHPVANARGVVMPLAYGPEVLTSASFKTGTDGALDVSLPPGSEGEVNVFVEATGWPVAAFRASVPGTLDLQLPLSGGRLVITAADRGAASRQLRSLVLLGQQGAAVPLSGLVSYRVEDGVGTLASLAPGTWRLVRMPRFEDMLSLLGAQGLAAADLLAEISITPGAVAEVTLPGGADTRAR